MVVSMLSALKMAGGREQNFPHNMYIPVGDTSEIPYGNGPPIDGQPWATYDSTVGAYFPSPPGGSYYLTPPDTLQDPSLGYSLPHQPEQWWNGYSQVEPTNDIARQLAHARRGSATRTHHQQRGRREATPRHRPTPIKKPASRSSLRDRVVEHARESTRKTRDSVSIEMDLEHQSILEDSQVPHPDPLINNEVRHSNTRTNNQPPHPSTLAATTQAPHPNTPKNTDHFGHTGTAYQHVANVEECKDDEQNDGTTSAQDKGSPPGLLPANWRAGKRPEGNRKNGGIGHFGLEHGFQVLWRRPR